MEFPDQEAGDAQEMEIILDSALRLIDSQVNLDEEEREESKAAVIQSFEGVQHLDFGGNNYIKLEHGVIRRGDPRLMALDILSVNAKTLGSISDHAPDDKILAHQKKIAEQAYYAVFESIFPNSKPL